MPTPHPLPLLQGEREREPALESPTRSGPLCTRTCTRTHTYVRVTLSPVSAGLCSAPGEACGFSKGQARPFSVKGQMANTAGITGHMVPAGTTQAGPRSVNAGQYVDEWAEPWQIWPVGQFADPHQSLNAGEAAGGTGLGGSLCTGARHPRLPPRGTVINRVARVGSCLVRSAQRRRLPGVVTECVLVFVFWLSGEPLQEWSRVPVPSSPQTCHNLFF